MKHIYLIPVTEGDNSTFIVDVVQIGVRVVRIIQDQSAAEVECKHILPLMRWNNNVTDRRPSQY